MTDALFELIPPCPRTWGLLALTAAAVLWAGALTVHHFHNRRP